MKRHRRFAFLLIDGCMCLPGSKSYDEEGLSSLAEKLGLKPVSVQMFWLQGNYTARFNARHKLWGHVFSGRCKAVLVQIDKGDYFCNLLDYIHLNPLRAGIVKLADGLDRFPWSSLAFYQTSLSRRKSWQEAKLGFDVNGLQDNAAGRRKFLQALVWRAGLEEAEKAGLTEIEEQGLQATLRRGWYFGNQEFREKC